MKNILKYLTKKPTFTEKRVTHAEKRAKVKAMKVHIYTLISYTSIYE